MNKTLIGIFFPALLLGTVACSSETAPQPDFPYESYALANGLQVVLQRDTTDPFVAVAVHYLAGPAAEHRDNAGYANLVRSILSGNSGSGLADDLPARIESIGGASGSETDYNGTLFFEAIPYNALEAVLGLQAARMSLSANVFDRDLIDRHVAGVVEEHLRLIDRQPYGYTYDVLHRNLFPEQHPLHLQATGRAQNLAGVTPEKVAAYYRQNFTPSNATLAISGNFSAEDAREMIDQHFAVIPGGAAQSAGTPETDEPAETPGNAVNSGNTVNRGNTIKPGAYGSPESRESRESRKSRKSREPAALQETKKLFVEDSLVSFPYLTMAWPTVHRHHPDAPALKCLAAVLSHRNRGVLYNAMVNEKQLTRRVLVMDESWAAGGKFSVIIPTAPGTSLAETERAVLETMQQFLQNSLPDKILDRVKASLETNAYKGLESIYRRVRSIATSTAHTGSPTSFMNATGDLLAVSEKDIRRVFRKYILNQDYVLTAFIPGGQTSGLPENILQATVHSWESVAADLRVGAETGKQLELPIPESLRNLTFPSAQVSLTVPEVWYDEFENGLQVIGNVNRELPWISFTLEISGGHLAEPEAKAGIAHLTADLLRQGAGIMAPSEMNERLLQLGTELDIRSGLESIAINVTTLSRNLDETVDLIEALILDPAWDDEQLAMAKLRLSNYLEQRQADPNHNAFRLFNEKVYGRNTLPGIPTLGTVETVRSVTIGDVADFHEKVFRPGAATLFVAGDADREVVQEHFASLVNHWNRTGSPELADLTIGNRTAGKINRLELPGADRTVLVAGNMFIPESFNQYRMAEMVSYALAGPGENPLNQLLSEDPRVNMRAGSGINQNSAHATFMVTGEVMQGDAEDAVSSLKNALLSFSDETTPSEFQSARDAFAQTLFKAYESNEETRDMLVEMVRHDLDPGYRARSLEAVRSMTFADFRALAGRMLSPDSMVFIIAGPSGDGQSPVVQAEME